MQAISASAPRQGGTYRADIDGLRAVAVTSVVLYHSHLGVCRSGYVGVDIFFVISGYLIAGIIFAEIIGGRFSFAGFYARRARRILPALIPVVAASAGFAMLVLSPSELVKFANSAVATLLGMSNLYFYHDAQYFSADAVLKPLLMTWSLGVEEQFYLLFPILLALLYKFLPRFLTIAILLITLGSLAISIGLTARAPVAAFYLPMCRAWELGCGALLAIRQVKAVPQTWPQGMVATALSLAGLALLGIAIFGLNPAAPYPGWRCMLPVFGTLAMILSKQSFVNRHVLSLKPVVGLGLISYSWYLWHWPLFSFANVVSVTAPLPRAMILLLLVSLILALFSYRYVERPFRQVKLRRAQVLGRYGAALAAGLVILLVVRLDHGVPRRFAPVVALTDAQIIGGLGSACLAGYGDSSVNTSPACVTPGTGPLVALIGDSHANALAPMLRTLAARNGFGAAEFTKSSCPALDGVVRLLPSHPQNAAQCLDYNAKTLRMLDDPRIKIVVIAGYWAAPASMDGDRYIRLDEQDRAASSLDLLRDGLIAEEDKLRKAGKRVVVLGDVPYFNFNPAQRVLAQLIPARSVAHEMMWGDDGLQGNRAGWRFISMDVDGSATVVRAAVAAVPGVVYLDPAAEFCSAGGCMFEGDSGQLFYSDPQHLSPAGSLRLLDVTQKATFGDTVFKD